jgi:cobalamin biosynthesis Mg chelatase CobN
MYKIIYNAETEQTTQEELSFEDIEMMSRAEELANEIKESNSYNIINENKISAIEKLKALGLTEEEAKALAGI